MRQSLRAHASHDWFEAELPEPFEREDQTWDILPVSTRVDVVDVPVLRVRKFHLSDVEVAAVFRQAVDEWQTATAAESNAAAIVMHPAYQRIIGLGPDAVPLIIEALRTEVDHWFWALRAIVGRDVAEGSKSLPEAAQRWIEWYDAEHV